MRMFSKIKGVPNHEIDEQSDQLLTQVYLADVKHAQVGSFSGGMKRRLSVAISAIGNPRIIFFDEPTTGMDPVSRHNVWELMQNLKKDKTIVLTTHAMEEADILADRIAVVAEGKLKCVGSSLNLKNTYGDGYRISLVLSKTGIENKVIQLMNTVAPSNKFVDDSGGSMLFTVPLSSTREIARLFKLLESSQENIQYDEDTDSYETSEDPSIKKLRALIQDVGISHATLEEVFMKLTGNKEQKAHRTKKKSDNQLSIQNVETL